MTTFKVGEEVEKIGGDYSFKGTVVAAFNKLSGAVRYVVEDDRGVLHVYSDKVLKLAPAKNQFMLAASPGRCSSCRWAKNFVGARSFKPGNLNCTNIEAIPSGVSLSGSSLDKTFEVHPNFGCIHFKPA